jgi:hypothetical protein
MKLARQYSPSCGPSVLAHRSTICCDAKRGGRSLNPGRIVEYATDNHSLLTLMIANCHFEIVAQPADLAK